MADFLETENLDDKVIEFIEGKEETDKFAAERFHIVKETE